MELDKSFWQERYLTNHTPWDIGHISTPLKELIDSLQDKTIKVLVPGAGRAYEAVYFFRSGFENIFVCDWVVSAFDILKEKCKDFPASNILVDDFFNLEGKYDLIIEQTFFCAIDPSLRPKYVQKVAELLNKNGMITGLFFASKFERKGPPFGGTKEEYESLFMPQFHILEMNIAQNSILPRMGNELFFKMIVK